MSRYIFISTARFLLRRLVGRLLTEHLEEMVQEAQTRFSNKRERFTIVKAKLNEETEGRMSEHRLNVSVELAVLIYRLQN